MTQEVEQIAVAIVEALSKTQPGWTPLQSEVEKAKRTGEQVTLTGYKLLWQRSQRWVGQLPLAFRAIRGRTR